MSADQIPAPTRVDPLSVRLNADAGQITLHVGDRKVASAWGPAADDRDAWFLWNGHTAAYRISGGRPGALALMEDRRDDWQRRESSLWHPDHGEPDERGYVGPVPADRGCVGCDLGLASDFGVATVLHQVGPEITRHYICHDCECYLEDDDEDDEDDEEAA
jgi:hypothetical protein